MTDSHPRPARFAALDAELLPAEEAASLRSHLRACLSCARVQADLTALRHELADLSVPALPDAVAARIDAAVAAEADKAQRSPLGALRSGTVSRETVPHRNWRRMALAAATAIFLLGVGSAAIQALETGASTHWSGADTATWGESSDGAAGSAETELDRRHTEVLGGQVRELLSRSEAAATERAEMFDDGRLPGSAPPTGWDAVRPTEPLPDATSGSTRESAPSPIPPTSSATEGPVPPLPSCVREAIGRQEAPLAAGEEDYRGEMAYVVVLPHPADPDRVDAYVIDADCVTASPGASGEVLVRESYPRQ